MPNHFGMTHRGLVRAENEDCFGIREIGSAAYLYVVCDGVGGSGGGKQASALALSSFSDFIHKQFGAFSEHDWTNLSLAQIKRTMRAAASEASRCVFTVAQLDPTLAGMASTLVAALVTPNRIYVINVGDSRLYTVSEKGVEKITRDHSYIQYLLDVGRITPEQVKDLTVQNYITQAIGVYEHADGDFCALELSTLHSSTYLLLCSDGLYTAVPEALLQNTILETQDVTKQAESLIDAACRHGGKDNITVVMVSL